MTTATGARNRGNATNSRVKTVAQYKLIDDAPSSAFQSGVRFINGTAKPAYAAYQLPIWVVKKGANVLIYGQLRPGADSAPLQINVQHASGARPPACLRPRAEL